jgi:hypothetical protein
MCFSPVLLTLLINIHSRLSPRIFEKFQNGPNGILRGPRDTDLWKNLKAKISCQTPFKLYFLDFFVLGPPLLFAEGYIGAPIYWRIWSKMIVLGAPYLFSCQSLGFTKRKRKYIEERWRHYFKMQTNINRHGRKPSFEHMPAYRPPLFLITHYI